ncbi:MAG TPA: hypothetical protein VKP30_04305, partial [Polyangiaceae bacterium]|nr:hypothetical protein [Polyangiaceae bacterium]
MFCALLLVVSQRRNWSSFAFAFLYFCRRTTGILGAEKPVPLLTVRQLLSSNERFTVRYFPSIRGTS